MRMNVTDAGINWMRLTPEQIAELGAETMDAATLPLTATKYQDGTVIEHDPADGIRSGRGGCTSRHYGCHGDYVTTDGRAICTRWAMEHLRRVSRSWSGGPMANTAADESYASQWAVHVTTDERVDA